MNSIVFLGAGNLGFHLTNALLDTKGFQLIQVYNRNLSSLTYLQDLVAITDDINHLKTADIYILAVSDDSIAEVSSFIQTKNSLVVHTSGSVAMDLLAYKGRKGVLYPLQSFSKNKDISFKNIPICIEASRKEDLVLLEHLSDCLSKNVYYIDSSQRKALHLSAVFVNNFVNKLYQIGEDICLGNKIPFEVLHPLIMETANKIKYIDPKEAQTGPAIRNDQETIKRHLSMLDEHQKSIYTVLTNSIRPPHK